MSMSSVTRPGSAIRIVIASICGRRRGTGCVPRGSLGPKAPRSALTPCYFEDTQAAKVDRLASLDLDVFIDDLIDVFEQPHFPRHVRSILFDSSGKTRAGPCKAVADWEGIRREVFAR